MSQENVERLRAVYAEWANGNFVAGGELFAPDVSFETMSDGRTALGRDATAGFMREFLAQWRGFRIDAKEFIEADDTIFVAEQQRGTGKSSGIETEMNAYAVWTFRDGLVASVQWETDRACALKAAGLSE